MALLLFRHSQLPRRLLVATCVTAQMQRWATSMSRTEDLSLASSSNLTKEGKKTIDDLPGPSLLTTAYWLFVKGYHGKSHEMQLEQKKIYGPIWQSKFGKFHLVNVASAELIQQVIKQEGKYPVRCDLPHWKEYITMREQAPGMHTNFGEEWYRLRSVLNPKMLKIKEANMYAPTIQEVVTDLIKRIYFLRENQGQGTMVCNVTNELYKFGFEGICSILFEKRLGCLQENIPEETKRFIKAVGDMLTLSEIVIFLPKWTRSFLPYWENFIKAWDDIYEVSKKLVDAKLKSLDKMVQNGESVEGEFLTFLLSSNKLSLKEIYTVLTELLLGGVDTTSNTMSWTLYHLAKEPNIQAHLYQEISSVCPGNQIPTTEDLTKMPYLKAVVKEILRLYPVVHGNGRWIIENEVILQDYWFPKKTLFHMCHYAASHDEKDFPDPYQFQPERWLRTTERYKHNPFSSVPFGVGVRACVGRRVAELEMYFALARIMKHFEIQPDPSGTTVKPNTRTLMIPGSPINLNFIDRK